jgi:L-ascorbate metabolism protein UlaG (beta-lactamase superfamily)
MSVFGLVVSVCLIPFAVAPLAQPSFETDTIATSKGDLTIAFIGHGTLMFRFGAVVVHVDPVARFADYSRLPKASIILVTHEHGDHFDQKAIAKIRTKGTVVLLTAACARRMEGGMVMNNGDVKNIKGLKIEAVPAYNVVHMRKPGQPFHAKGVGNGYVITFGDKRLYVAGDTENIPEMAKLAGVDCAFLPMNVPYTMTPKMAADALRTLKPKIVYPYHFGDTDTSKLVELVKDVKNVEVRIRRMK